MYRESLIVSYFAGKVSDLFNSPSCGENFRFCVKTQDFCAKWRLLEQIKSLYFIKCVSGSSCRACVGLRDESFWRCVLESTSRHQVLTVSQTAATGSDMISPYTHSKNSHAKNRSSISPDKARLNKFALFYNDKHNLKIVF